MARDVQRGKVYAWEKVAYPDYKTRDLMTKEQVCELVRRVLTDVNQAGGIAPPRLVVQFTKRKGGACGSWRNLNFTPGKVTRHTVLHELAHALTWDYPARALIDKQFDAEGHGPRFVACLIALAERYAGFPAGPAVQTAHFFRMETWGPWYIARIEELGDGRRLRHKQRDKVAKFASVKISREMLRYWQDLLAKSVPEMKAAA